MDTRQTVRRVFNSRCRGEGCPRSLGKSIGVEGIDPWLEDLIRVADRQGVLTGKSLSIVQLFAIRVMLSLESKSIVEDQVREMKLSLMAQNPAELAPDLFPEYFAPVDVTDVPEGGGFQVVNAIKDSEVESYLEMMGVTRR
jgi:hypothetical protein